MASRNSLVLHFSYLHCLCIYICLCTKWFPIPKSSEIVVSFCYLHATIVQGIKSNVQHFTLANRFSLTSTMPSVFSTRFCPNQREHQWYFSRLETLSFWSISFQKCRRPPHEQALQLSAFNLFNTLPSLSPRGPLSCCESSNNNQTTLMNPSRTTKRILLCLFGIRVLDNTSFSWPVRT